jgi:hypothetical protein
MPAKPTRTYFIRITPAAPWVESSFSEPGGQGPRARIVARRHATRPVAAVPVRACMMQWHIPPVSRMQRWRARCRSAGQREWVPVPWWLMDETAESNHHRRAHPQLAPCSFGLSATSQQYFSLRTNQPLATSQQYFSLRTNQHQPSDTSRTNRL